MKGKLGVDDHGIKFHFCPAKATWYADIAELFSMCRLAFETGILPGDGGFQDQRDDFVEVFPEFVMRWKERSYHHVWRDVQTYVEAVLKAIFGKGK